MVSIIRATPGDLVVEVLRRVNDAAEDFTATAGGSATITAPVPLSTTTDFYKNTWIYIYAGTSAGDERLITGYSSSRVFTAEGNFTSTPTTSSKAVVSDGIRPSDVYNAIVAAIKEASYYFHRPLTDTSMRVGNILHNGHFQLWDNSSSVTVGTAIYTSMESGEGWIPRGSGNTANRESVIIPAGDQFVRYSGKLISDGSNLATYEYAVPNWERYVGKTLTVKGKLYTTTGSRVFIRVSDGVDNHDTDTGGSSGTHTGTAGWEELSNDSVTVEDAATQLIVTVGVIAAGGAVTCYVGDVRLYENDGLWDRETRVPPWLDYVDAAYQETGTPGRYKESPIGMEDYHYGSHPNGYDYLRFIRNPVQTMTVDRRLMLEGVGLRTDTIAVTTNIENAPQLIAHMATMEVLGGRLDTDKRVRAYSRAKEEVDRFFARGKLARVETGHAV